MTCAIVSSPAGSMNCPLVPANSGPREVFAINCWAAGRWVHHSVPEWQPSHGDCAGRSRQLGSGHSPNVIRDPVLESPTITRWFDTAAFANPAPFTIGNSARNNMIGPGINNWDVIISKHFYLAEGHRIQLRGEFFNAF